MESLDVSKGVPPVGSTVDRVGAAARGARAAALDRFLGGLLPAPPAGVALVAVGGLGRRDCAPHSDLDLLLLHTGEQDVATLAAALWYPIWDARLRLDHSVRTPAEALDVAAEDLAVALGLLDARHVTGDPGLTAGLRAAALDQWRRTAPRTLPALREATDHRHQRHGALAFLLEGDLKESAGGLRDLAVLRGIGYAGVAETMRPEVRAAQTRLLDVRDALHLCAGRRLDRLLAQERDRVAARLGLADRDALLRRVAADAGTLTHAVDDAWRAVRRWRAHPRRLARGGCRSWSVTGRDPAAPEPCRRRRARGGPAQPTSSALSSTSTRVTAPISP